MKMFWGVPVIRNTTRDIFIEHFYPLSEVETEIKRFMNKIPLNWVKSFLEI